MFLAMTVPVTLSVILSKSDKKLHIAILAAVSVSLILLQCRTALMGAILSTVIVIGHKYNLTDLFRKEFSKLARTALLTSALLATIIFSWYLYQLKKDSADGRRLIWKVSFSMLFERPILGFGYDTFERNYNLYQANYIEKNHIKSGDIKTAGYVKMAYNELLQNTIEGGVFGTLILTSIFISFLSAPVRRKIEVKERQTIQSALTPTAIYVTCYSVISGFIAMSMVNFAIQAIPSMCLFMLFCGVLATHPFYNRVSLRTSEAKKWSIQTVSIGMVCLLAGCFLFYSQAVSAKSNLLNKTAAILIRRGEVAKSLQILQSLRDELESFPSYWRNYGEALIAEKRFNEAIGKYHRAAKLSSNPEIYKKLALCYEKTQQNKQALFHYDLASSLEPNRLSPKYELMRMYIKAGYNLQAQLTAEQILAVKPKKETQDSKYFQRQALMVLQATEPGEKGSD